MEENKMLEKIWSEAQHVEVPTELTPERMKERIEAETKTVTAKNTKNKSKKERGKFHWQCNGSRVAAAAIVLAASLGAYGVASSQPLSPAPLAEQENAAESGVQIEDVLVSGETPDMAAADAAEEVPITDTEEPVVKELGDYHLAEGYEEVYAMLQVFVDAEKARQDWQKEAATGEADDVAGASSANVTNAVKDLQEETKLGAEEQNFSTTNLQVTGVDESDIVKTDGHYIYIATDDQVQIVDASMEEPRQLGSIKPKFSGNMDRIREMYVADGKLILIAQVEDTDELPAAALEDEDNTYVIDGEDEKHIKYEFIECEDMAYVDCIGTYAHIHTQVLTYDITSPAGAKLLGTFEQDGSYASSRKIGDQLYLFTDYGMSGFALYRAEEENASDDEIQLPKIQGQTIPEDCIYLPKEGSSSGVLISAMDVNDPEKATDQKMIFNGGAQMYVTGDSIYLYRIKYNSADDRVRTDLTRFKIGDGRITADCAEAVPGYLEDTFAIHESKDGFLYVLTTTYESETVNRIYVLDEKLKIHGKIENIAVGETVYAARFIDDIGYFVTYRNMDPLFTVDFSDPANPTLIGELEIPGFSDYLQFWDDTYLIGVGEERKAKDSEFVGIKVSLYDISDPTNVTESAKVVLEDASYAPASYNYKALLSDSKKNIIAFLTEDKGGELTVSQQIFTVKDGKLVEEAADKLEGGSEYYAAADYRNLYIGDKLYLVREGLVIVYDMSDGFARTATLKLT